MLTALILAIDSATNTYKVMVYEIMAYIVMAYVVMALILVWPQLRTPVRTHVYRHV